MLISLIPSAIKADRNYLKSKKKPSSSLEYASNIATSNGNASETKANKSFDNGVFFAIEAKQTPLIVSKLFLKRSEHIR
jgi:hypothetical protein